MLYRPSKYSNKNFKRFAINFTKIVDNPANIV